MPPALLFIALGLALTFAPRGAWVPSLLALAATLGAFSSWSVPPVWVEGVFLGCWISVIATALSVHLGRRLTRTAALVSSLNAGVWASAVASMSGSRLDLLRALPCVLIFLPASWVTGRHTSIPVKVVSSWVIAVALLAAILQFVPVTPGYLPDHME